MFGLFTAKPQPPILIGFNTMVTFLEFLDTLDEPSAVVDFVEQLPLSLYIADAVEYSERYKLEIKNTRLTIEELKK